MNFFIQTSLRYTENKLPRVGRRRANGFTCDREHLLFQLSQLKYSKVVFFNNAKHPQIIGKNAIRSHGNPVITKTTTNTKPYSYCCLPQVSISNSNDLYNKVPNLLKNNAENRIYFISDSKDGISRYKHPDSCDKSYQSSQRYNFETQN